MPSEKKSRADTNAPFLSVACLWSTEGLLRLYLVDLTGDSRKGMSRTVRRMLQNLKIQFINGFNRVDSSVRTGFVKQKAF
jgi:hypothetical protein